MTETEWLVCADPKPMLEFLQGNASDRKLRLFAVGCCRRIWHLLHLAVSRVAVEMAERFADGEATVEELEQAWSQADTDEQPFVHAQWAAFNAARREWENDAVSSAYYAAQAVMEAGGGDPALQTERAQQCELLRCIFGNSFRPVSLDSAWLTLTVKQLAQAIYNDRAFDRLPILADALDEAGCTDTEILNHCRQPGVHVRGCWVVDLMSGRE